MRMASVSDYREQARRRLPHFLFEYIDGGSVDEITLRSNTRDLQQILLRQRVLNDVEDINTETELFGMRYSLPAVLAPVGLAGLNTRRGEVQAALAAEGRQVPFILSMMSVCDIQEVSEAVSNPLWFQLYMVKDRHFMIDLLTRVRQTGSEVLVVTVDLPKMGIRYRDFRSGLAGCTDFSCRLWRLWQILSRPRWIWDVGVMGGPHTLGNLTPLLGSDTGLEDFLDWTSRNFDPSATWSDLEFVRDNWPGKIVVKGILDPEDAKQAARCEVDGIVVSNHGGRQLDGVPSTVKALPAIADTLHGALKILVDGGIRSGLDIIRMLALGADGVLIGRPWAYALGSKGEQGVRDVLELLQEELNIAMALTGHNRIDTIDRKMLVG